MYVPFCRNESTQWMVQRNDDSINSFFAERPENHTLLTDCENSLFTCPFQSDVYYFHWFIRIFIIGSVGYVCVCHEFCLWWHLFLLNSLSRSKNHTFNLDTFRAYLFRPNMFVLELVSQSSSYFFFFQSFRNLYSICRFWAWLRTRHSFSEVVHKYIYSFIFPL